MRRLALVGSLCTTLFAALPAAGGTMLYATAASLGRVDGFCVGAGGGFVPGASVVHADTGGTEPRRLLVANGVLYVGERDRVEAFTIGRGGGLKFLASTRLIKNELAMDVMDMAFSPDGRTLYVAQNGPDRIAAYPLDAMGALKDFTSCIQGRPKAAYRALLVSNSLLYVSEQLTPGRIANFPIDAGGGLGHDPTECSGQRPKVCNAGSRAGQVCTTDDTTGCPGATCPACCTVPRVCQGGSRAGQVCTTDGTKDPTTGCPGAACPGCCVAATAPLSNRPRIQRPRSFRIIGDRIYVEEVATKRIKAFRLEADGLFPEPPLGKRNQPLYQKQKPVSRTASVLAYVDLVLFRSTLLASQFEKGRIDAYRLKPPDNSLSPQPKSTKEDVRTTPVRMTVSQCSGGSNDGLACASDLDCPGGTCPPVSQCNRGSNDGLACDSDMDCPRGTCPSPHNVLYVAAGEFDRVQAYRLRKSGLPEATPFSQTDEQTGSFPNDVALAMLSEGCR